MINLINRFRKDESGAVTVDWVVLTAGIVGLAIAVGLTFRGSLTNVVGEIDSALQANFINTAVLNP